MCCLLLLLLLKVDVVSWIPLGIGVLIKTTVAIIPGTKQVQSWVYALHAVY